ncbi:hypothetical protein CLOP_g14534 [Closterium sp. NIES-67]|nr:hypothetical protein CLOP_g14534 [Closterium sp. NIES-67]
MAPAFRVTEGSANSPSEPRAAGAKANASGRPAMVEAVSSASGCGSDRLQASAPVAAVSSDMVESASQESQTARTPFINDPCHARINADLAACDVAARVVAHADVAAELDGNGHTHEHARCSPVLRRKPMDVPSKKVRQLFASGEDKGAGLDDGEEDGARGTWTESLEPESQFSDMNVLMTSGSDGMTLDSLIGGDALEVKGSGKEEGSEEATEEFLEEIEFEIEEEEVEEEEDAEDKGKGKVEESDSDEDDDDDDDESEDEEGAEEDDEENRDEGEEEEEMEDEGERLEDGYQIVLKVGQVMLPCKVRYDNEEIVQIVKAVDDSEIVEVVDDVADNDNVSLLDVDKRADCQGHVRTCTSLPVSKDNPPRVLSLSMDDSCPPSPSSPTSPFPPISHSPPPSESLEQELAFPTIPTAPSPPPPKSILKPSFVERSSNASAACGASVDLKGDLSRKRQRDGSQRDSADGERKGTQGGVCAESRGLRPTARERVQRQMAAAEAAVKMLADRCKVDFGNAGSCSLAADAMHQMELLCQAVSDVTKPRKRLRFADELGKELNHVRFIPPRM